jgi:hypothetical protein
MYRLPVFPAEITEFAFSLYSKKVEKPPGKTGGFAFFHDQTGKCSQTVTFYCNNLQNKKSFMCNVLIIC